MAVTEPLPFAGPCIEPKLSWDLIEKRDAFLSLSSRPQSTIPEGFPDKITSPCISAPGELNLDNVTYVLKSADIEELEVALQRFQTRYNDPNLINHLTFSLPTLGPRLREISIEVHHGQGVFILQGLSPEKYSFRENIILFAGISNYIADMRGKQSGEGDLITHIRPSPMTEDPRTILTTEALPFHNDVGEVLGLYVYQPAKYGGNTLISSAGHVYNEIARTKPYLISVLAERNWPHWTARKPHQQMDFPVLYAGNNVSEEPRNPYFDYGRYTLTGSKASPRPKDIRPLTADQADAMDTIEIIAAKNAITLPQRKGDIHFISNTAFFHGRTAIPDDSPESRHLMRMVLRDSELGYTPAEDQDERCGRPFDFPLEQGKWIVDKENMNQLVSSRRFESLYFDATSHSDS